MRWMCQNIVEQRIQIVYDNLEYCIHLSNNIRHYFQYIDKYKINDNKMHTSIVNGNT
jgi:hypothetical protein